MNGTGEFDFNSDRNYDEETLLQTKEIEKQIASAQYLISPLESIANLDKEFENDAAFLKKIQELKQKFKQFRRTRADGNCFFRSFAFATFEYLMNNSEEYNKFKDAINVCKDDLINLGFPRFTLEDFYETFTMELSKIELNCSISKIEDTFNDSGISDYIVVFLRLVVSGHLQKNEDFFQSFVEGDRGMKEFCNQEVEPMNRESDHLHIIALCQATKICLQVDYLDRNDGKLVSHIFPEDGKPMIHLLYKPGHYDILYK